MDAANVTRTLQLVPAAGLAAGEPKRCPAGQTLPAREYENYWVIKVGGTGKRGKGV
jgi:hypothetical protein